MTAKAVEVLLEWASRQSLETQKVFAMYFQQEWRDGGRIVDEALGATSGEKIVTSDMMKVIIEDFGETVLKFPNLYQNVEIK